MPFTESFLRLVRSFGLPLMPISRHVHRLLVAALALCSVALAPPAGEMAADSDSVLASLVEAERSFAGAALARGVRAGFLEYLAEEAIVFRPRPVAARAWYQGRPDGREVLTWEPTFAEASAAGDLGYTTGPWELRAGPSDADPTVRGHYVSVWRRRPDGSWRVLIDAGVSHGRPEPHAGPAASRRSADPSGARELEDAKLRRERSALMERDLSLSETTAKGGSLRELIASFSDDVRVYREGSLPVIGKDAARAALAAGSRSTRWRPEGAVVCRSDDLGYTYGMASDGASEPGGATGESSYLRIWRKSRGEWRVILDLAVPIPV